MKNDITIRFSLDRDIAKQIAEKKLPPKKYSDEMVSKLVDQMRPTLIKAFADVEKGYHDGAKQKYDKSGAKELFEHDAAELAGAFDNLCAAYEDTSCDTFTIPDDDGWGVVEKLISTCTILCYPSFQLSDKVTDREILIAARDVFINGAIRKSDLDGLRSITRDDIFCLREATDETPLSGALFMSLERCCLAAAKRMKSSAARDEALMFLDLLDILQTRTKRYDVCLRPETAKKFVAGFKAAQNALLRIVRYENL